MEAEAKLLRKSAAGLSRWQRSEREERFRHRQRNETQERQELPVRAVCCDSESGRGTGKERAAATFLFFLILNRTSLVVRTTVKIAQWNTQ